MTEIEIKLEVFKAIVSNSQNLCDSSHFITPSGAAQYTNDVYEILTEKES